MKRFGSQGWVWAAAALIGVGALGFFLVRQGPSPPTPPVVALAGLDPAVKALLEELRRAVELDGRSGVAWGRLGLALRGCQLKAEARQCLGQAARLDPADPRWSYFLGDLLLEEDEAAGLAQVRRAAELSGEEALAVRLRLGQLLLERGHWDEAARCYEAMLQAAPVSGRARLGLARVSFARGDDPECLRLLEPCLADEQTRKAAWTLGAMAWRRRGRAAEADAARTQAASLPDDVPDPEPFATELARYQVGARVLIERCQQLLSSGDPAVAEPWVKRLMMEYPGANEGWLYWGRLRLLAGDLVGAEAALARHLQGEPDSVDGRLQLGLVFLQQQRFTEAETNFLRAVHLKPDGDMAHYQLALALLSQGRAEEALAHFRQAARCRPTFAEAYLMSARVLGQLGRSAEAERLLEEGLTASPLELRLQTALDEVRGR